MSNADLIIAERQSKFLTAQVNKNIIKEAIFILSENSQEQAMPVIISTIAGMACSYFCGRKNKQALSQHCNNLRLFG